MKSLMTRISGTTANRHADFANELRGMFRRGLSDLQRFILISAAFFMVRDFDLYQAFPENVLRILGCAPPPHLVLIALTGYVFTVIAPLLVHMLSGNKPTENRWHLIYRSIFYLFFLCSGTLPTYFILVLATGIALYLMEQTGICVAFSRASHGDSQPA